MVSKTKVYLAYDERMTLHRPPKMTEDPNSPEFYHERPSRLLAVYQSLMALEKRLLAERDQEEIKIQSIIRGDFDHDAPMIGVTSEGGDNIQQQYLLPEQRFVPLNIIPGSRETICRVHCEEHYDFMKSTSTLSEKALRRLTNDSEDLYFCRDTFGAALLAVGGCVAAVNAVTSPFNIARRAMALIRPPAHHATRDAAMGK